MTLIAVREAVLAVHPSPDWQPQARGSRTSITCSKRYTICALAVDCTDLVDVHNISFSDRNSLLPFSKGKCYESIVGMSRAAHQPYCQSSFQHRFRIWSRRLAG
jgi:hypothetical protein